MSEKPQSDVILKVIILGCLIAALAYLFHPGVGQLGLLINGQPVANPLFGIAALPIVLLVMLFVAILTTLVMLGVGMLIFTTAATFALLGILIIAPYFWPVLVMIGLIILIMSSGNNKNS